MGMGEAYCRAAIDNKVNDKQQSSRRSKKFALAPRKGEKREKSVSAKKLARAKGDTMPMIITMMC